MAYKELATGAVNSFSKRICPKLQFQPMSKIDDEMETIIYYIKDAINWVWSLVTRATDDEIICPFQVDFCFAVGAPISAVVKEELRADDPDDDDDDDDEDFEEDERWNDVVGSIKERLDANELKYYKKEHQNADVKESGIFANIYRNFVSKHRLGGSQEYAYLHKKRLIAMTDRRRSKKDANKPDDIWMYEPPADCQYIPDDPVPEWYFNSSATCIGPKTATRSSFGATSHCKRGTLTFSFHVKEGNIIKCYLFWNGAMTRFMPEDIKTVLPALFNPKKQCKHNNEEEYYLDELIKDLKEKLVDEQFYAFMD
eukprot:628026_1